MKELLVPCGNMECLHAAINNGCDAVYLGGKRFGARAYAGNFTDEEMSEAIKLCHIYGVKVYVTVNTLVHESELPQVLDYLKFLYKENIDAVIVQDIGLISLIKNNLPNLEVHASTQVHSTNKDTLDFLKNLGVKRVVLAREMSIDEINNLDTDLEIEAFIHGAICVSYSGQCLFSSMLMNRSGNRGECAQMCRLPYKLKKNNEYIKTEGEYLLSPKELNTSSNFKAIMDSNITSLKIEGRMKSAEFVGCVTRFYRDLMDKYYKGKPLTINEEMLKDLKTIFNREFNHGFLFSATNKELMNIKTSNHLGIPLGSIIEVNKKYIKVKLDEEINQGDGIRFIPLNEGMIANFIYDLKGNLISGAKKGSIISLDHKFNVKVGDKVCKTLDIRLKDKYLNTPKKIPITMDIICHKGNQMKLTITHHDKSVSVCYGDVLASLKTPITRDTIIKQMSKLGNTFFYLDNITIELDENIFINLKDLNELRRLGITSLINELTKVNTTNNEPLPITPNEQIYNEELSISILARTEEQVKCALDNHIKRIYIPDYELYKKYQDKENIYYRTNRVKDTFTKEALITELGSLNRIRKGVGDYYLNVCNHASIDYLSKYVKYLTLSIELSDEEIKNIMSYYNNKCNVEIIIYGTIEAMLTKYCPLNLNVNKSSICNICTTRDKYTLVDRNNKEYPIISDPTNHLTHIMFYKPLDKRDKCAYYYSLGIRNYRLELLDSNYEETQNLINSLNFNN